MVFEIRTWADKETDRWMDPNTLPPRTLPPRSEGNRPFYTLRRLTSTSAHGWSGLSVSHFATKSSHFICRSGKKTKAITVCKRRHCIIHCWRLKQLTGYDPKMAYLVKNNGKWWFYLTRNILFMVCIWRARTTFKKSMYQKYHERQNTWKIKTWHYLIQFQSPFVVHYCEMGFVIFKVVQGEWSKKNGTVIWL